MIPISVIPIPLQIAALVRERNSLLEYPADKLAGIIKDIGFRCTSCTKCCTRAFNGHVFLLDREVAGMRVIEPAALEPAPAPEFCDQNGIFYVSGFAVKARDNERGSCIFLDSGRCRIYPNRPSICRVYPYMLHREPDRKGRIDWRQFSGLDQHGEYDAAIPYDQCLEFARITKEYENAFLTHEIHFLEFIDEYFTHNGLIHSQKVYDNQMRLLKRGKEVTVMVFSGGTLEEYILPS